MKEVLQSQVVECGQTVPVHCQVPLFSGFSARANLLNPQLQNQDPWGENPIV